MQNAARYFRSWFGHFEVVAARRPDPWLWLPASALLILGTMMVLNTTYFMELGSTGDGFHLLKLHLCHIALGALVLGFFSQLSLKGLGRMAPPLMLLSAVLLLAVWVPGMGVIRGGARRWLRLGPVLVEPSELFKFALVLFLARFLARRGERLQSFKSGPLAVFAVAAPLALTVLKQPDFGATAMIALLVFVMLYAAGARTSHLVQTGAGAALLLALQALARSYRVRRLTAFLHPWQTARGAGFQLIQSLIAIAAGGGWGVGLGAGHQKMFYLPQAHTDFIFAVIGEDLGIAGAAAVIALFCVIMWRGMRIAREEPDPFASLLAVGLSASLALQALVNVAVVIGMAPTKGLPLPFVSYGGTATVMAMADLGILLALGRRPAVR
jgi:cell division protein FtsW